MKIIRGRRKKKNILLRFAVVVFAGYFLFLLISQQIEIQQKRTQLSQVKQEIELQEIKNNDIENSLDSGTDSDAAYIEQKAREELGYAKPGERVYINIAGE